LKGLIKTAAYAALKGRFEKGSYDEAKALFLNWLSKITLIFQSLRYINSQLLATTIADLLDRVILKKGFF